ncbi:hypothetical protein J2S19_000402 [Metabacillus malikii]|uniref:DUF4260 family protein n=2 Tax=Metabacillus malikii TaxID=1504265 RepID=A0ABT9ZA91_9BACI|nr:hypothetical protein [Metabacillus malikii]
MKQVVRIENGIAFVLSFYLFTLLDFPVWLFFLLLMIPDITMVGYAFNNKIGAKVYNFGHSLVVPLLLTIGYFFYLNEYLLLTIIIWVAHIFMDRFLGFGLKYEDSFKSTHIHRL